jgi:hypothetical protein
VKVQATTKDQPNGSLIKAVAKIVEALDPLNQWEREKCVEAALLLIGNEDLARRLLRKE